MQQIALEEDFVSFKLDIDTPTIEIPIALQLSRDPAVAKLVDEFFFELHFDCEFMVACGWGFVPDYFEDFKLDRQNAMKLMLDTRKLGVRAHFWP